MTCRDPVWYASKAWQCTQPSQAKQIGQPAIRMGPNPLVTQPIP